VGGTVNSLIEMDAGNDVVIYNGSDINNTIDGGNGTDSIYLANYTVDNYNDVESYISNFENIMLGDGTVISGDSSVFDGLISTSSSTTTVSGTANGGDIEPGDTVTVTVNGTEYTTTVANDGTYSVDVNNSDLEANPEVSVSVASTDIAGNSTTTTSETTATITVNDAPEATNDSSSVEEGNSVIIDVLSNDTDSNGDQLSLSSVDSTVTDSNGNVIGTAEIVNIDGKDQIKFTATDEDSVLSDGDSSNVSFNYTLQDTSGATDTASVTVNVSGDSAPVLVADEDQTVNISKEYTSSSDSSDTNIIVTFDVSGSMVGANWGGVVQLEDGTTTTRFELAKEALSNTIESYEAQGDVSVNLTLFGADAYGVGWMSGDDAVSYLETLTMSSDGKHIYADGNEINMQTMGTDYYDGIEKTMDIDFTGHEGANNVGLFMSDGNPNQNMGNVDSENDQAIQDWTSFIQDNNIDLNVIGFGGITDTSYLDVLQVQDDQSAMLVDNMEDLNQALVSTTGETVTGNIADTSNIDFQGGEFGEVVSVDVGGTTYTADTFPENGITTPEGGILTVDFDTGDYSYIGLPGNFDEDVSETFTMTVADSDGDTVDVDLNINIDVTISHEISQVVDSDTTANAIDENVEDGTYTGVTLAATDADGDAITYSLPDDVPFSVDENGRVVTNGEIDFESNESFTFTATATSADGTSSTQEITINVNDINENTDTQASAPVLDMEIGDVNVVTTGGGLSIGTVTNLDDLADLGDVSDGSSTHSTSGDLHNNLNAGNESDQIDINGNAKKDINLGGGDNKLDIDGYTNGNINAGNGDDTVNIQGDANKDVNLGSGDNTLQIDGLAKGNINLGSGDDTVNVGVETLKDVNLGDGDNKLEIDGNAKGNINTGTGNDNIDVHGYTNKDVNVGDGDDIVNIEGDANKNVNLGSGENELSIGGNAKGEISGGNDDDLITIDGYASNTINLGEGDNQLKVDGHATHINAGNGDDTISVGDGSTGAKGDINLGSGNNILNVDGYATGQVNGGAGNDTINIEGEAHKNINLGEGTNQLEVGAAKGQINGGSGDDTINIQGYANKEVNLGNGNNKLEIDGDAKGDINSGTGNDEIDIHGYASKNINTGDGDDVVNIGGTAHKQVNLGNGNDELSIGGDAKQQITTGEGDDKVSIDGYAAKEIYLGNGNDEISIDGRIHKTIDGGQGDDTIHLNMTKEQFDNGYNGADKVVNFETIALNDGTYENGVWSNIITDDTEITDLDDLDDISFDSGTTSYEYSIDFSAQLTDTDGSESLSDITVDNLPDGATLTGDNVTDNGDGTFTVGIDENGEANATLESEDELTEDELNDITASVTSTEESTGDTATSSITDDGELGFLDDIDAVDFGEIAQEIDGVSTINMENETSQELTMNADDLINVNNDHEMVILGDDGDVIDLEGEGWTKEAENVSVDGEEGEFDVYTNTASDGTTVSVNVDVDVSVNTDDFF
jgi:hypothetical protein